MATQTPELRYASAPAWHRRKSFRRALLLASALALVVAAVEGYPHVRRHVLLQQWQRRCMEYQVPPAAVVYDRSVVTSAQTSAAPPRPTGTIIYGTPTQWSDLYRAISPPGLTSLGTAFLHARRTPAGNARLVAVDVSVATHGPRTNRLLLTYRVVEPAALIGRPRLLASDQKEFPLDESGDVRVLAGQPDPGDTAHFTLVYETAARQRTVDGWLRGDDSVVLETRR